jgi:hypothetical protein
MQSGLGYTAVTVPITNTIPPAAVIIAAVLLARVLQRIAMPFTSCQLFRLDHRVLVTANLLGHLMGLTFKSL